jgi:hypothetical protein
LLPELCGPDLVPFLFVRWELPSLEVALLPHFPGVQPLPAFGAAEYPVPFRHPISLIAPFVHAGMLSYVGVTIRLPV